MTCEECEIEAEGDALGWEAYLADLDDDGQDDVVFYCPVCAEREFHTTGSPEPPNARTTTPHVGGALGWACPSSPRSSTLGE
jgi:hypothetical protein